MDADGSCPDFGHTTSAVLNLGPLVNNGRPTRTQALLTGSVAIKAGDQTECTDLGVTDDQRGFTRDSYCDIGAFEYGACPPTDLVVSKSASLTTVRTSRKLTYWIHVENKGPDTAENVQVTDATPLGTTFISVSPDSCGHPLVGSGGTVTCNFGTLRSGDSATITLVVKVTARGHATVTNTAAAISDTSDPNLADNTAPVQTRVFGNNK